LDLSSQNAVSAAGGDAVGPAGMLSYTLGQVDYTRLEDARGRFYHGVQQPWPEHLPRAPEGPSPCFMYPNPASDVLFLELPVAGEVIVDLRILDARGLLVRDLPSRDRREGIPLGDVPPGAYFLRIRDSEGTQHLCRFLKVQ
jgi:hypothetical protein